MAKDSLSVHLAEYSALRTEADHYSQRIDRMSGIYLTVLFAILGYIIKPGSDFNITDYANEMQSSPSKITVFLAISIVNSIILVRLGGFYLGLLAISQYCDQIIRPKIDRITEDNTLIWDAPPALDAKRRWLPIRSAGQILFTLLAWTISMIIITLGTLQISYFSPLQAIIYIMALICALISAHTGIEILRAGRRFHSTPSEPTNKNAHNEKGTAQP